MIFAMSAAGVVPVIAAACGGNTSSNATWVGVGAGGFSVAMGGFGGTPTSGSSGGTGGWVGVGAGGFSVAAGGFGGTGGTGGMGGSGSSGGMGGMPVDGGDMGLLDPTEIDRDGREDTDGAPRVLPVRAAPRATAAAKAAPKKARRARRA
jgi:hypothetical protein